MKRYLLVLALVMLVALPSAAQYSVKVVDCPDAAVTRIWGINDNGQAVGWFHRLGEENDAIIYRDGVCENLQSLLPPDFPGSLAYGINNRGDVVGEYGGEGFVIRNGSATLFAYPGAAETVPQAINDNGVIVGYFVSEDGAPLKGFIRDEDGRISELSFPFPGLFDFLPVGINARGDVVGNWDTDPTTIGHGFLLPKQGKVFSFDVPGALPLGTFAAGINDRGDITGDFLRLDGTGASGFVLFGSEFITIDPPPTGINILPNAINNRRMIAGNVTDEKGRHGFIATPVKNRDR